MSVVDKKGEGARQLRLCCLFEMKQHGFPRHVWRLMQFFFLFLALTKGAI